MVDFKVQAAHEDVLGWILIRIAMDVHVSGSLSQGRGGGRWLTFDADSFFLEEFFECAAGQDAQREVELLFAEFLEEYRIEPGFRAAENQGDTEGVLGFFWDIVHKSTLRALLVTVGLLSIVLVNRHSIGTRHRPPNACTLNGCSLNLSSLTFVLESKPSLKAVATIQS